MGGPWSLLTDRPVPWWVMWAGHRAQVSSVTSPESSHLEGGKWLASSDNQQSGRSEAWGAGKSLGRELEIQTALGDERFGESPFHPCLPSPAPESEAPQSFGG